tara:strand:- start:6563 stop:6850 length:288 start_codon:yes stop_codon:yes gene_type:complete
MYYNTNKESGAVLKNSFDSTKKQEDLVLAVFQTYPKENLSPDDVQGFLVDNIQAAFPITSIRRSITNLTSNNKLEKTNKMKQGVWGKQTHTWKLK